MFPARQKWILPQRERSPHEENAEQVMELLKLLGIEKAMVSGYSTGGGIAFYLAKKYPETITAAFLMHSILLQG